MTLARSLRLGFETMWWRVKDALRTTRDVPRLTQRDVDGTSRTLRTQENAAA